VEELLTGFGGITAAASISQCCAPAVSAILSLSTASLDPDSEDPAAIISFRDVTPNRLMEDELRKTKDFLEKVIESSADAVVAADMKGTILIFNSVAERITGYRRDDVVGKMSAENLYAPGVGRQIMRRLRSGDYGGVGRYLSSREELAIHDGTQVPISLAAALLYDGGKEIASVGVFSDLRDRLRMEAELERAQRKLEVSERQSAIVELAGAAAHELSQPLTSILGSAELMARKLPPEAPATVQLTRILRECDRMAEIVKNIGRITRYETKPYLGYTNIVDLSASSKGEENR
jgi:PAS domain S-box-containing protein